MRYLYLEQQSVKELVAYNYSTHIHLQRKTLLFSNIFQSSSVMSRHDQMNMPINQHARHQ